MTSINKLTAGKAWVIGFVRVLGLNLPARIDTRWKSEPDFDVGRGPELQRTTPSVYTLALSCGDRRTTMKFTEPELSDCASEGPDGRELRARLEVQIRNAVKEIVSQRGRIGF